MHDTTSNYATLIGKKNIVFVPTCIIIEIMATIFSHISRLPLAGRMAVEDVEMLAAMLHRFRKDLASTVDAYENGKVGTFVGDWKLDRVKASRIFSLLMIKLAKIYGRVFIPYRDQVREEMEELKNEWDRLFSMLDAMAGRGSVPGDSPCRYFHSQDANTWRQTMAHIILSLNDSTAYQAPDTYLLLLCYTRVKLQLVRQIENIQHREHRTTRFRPERIICVSDDEIHMTCPICMRFSEQILRPSAASQRRVSRDTGIAYPVGAAWATL